MSARMDSRVSRDAGYSDTDSPQDERPSFAPASASGGALAVPGPTELPTMASGCDSSPVTTVADRTYPTLT